MRAMPACLIAMTLTGQAGSAPAVRSPGGDKAQATAVRNAATRPAARFKTLDDYLAYLRATAAIGRPWYRQIGPDRYVLVAGNYRPLDGKVPAPQTFTRAQLAARFGFRE